MLKREKKRANAAASKLSELGVELEFDPRTDEAEAFAAKSSSTSLGAGASASASAFASSSFTSTGSRGPPVGNGRPPTAPASKGRSQPQTAAAAAEDLNDSTAGTNPFAKNRTQTDPALQAAKKACMLSANRSNVCYIEWIYTYVKFSIS